VAAVVLALMAILLVISGAVGLSRLTEWALRGQEWCWAGWEAGGICPIREDDIEQTMRDAVEPYTLDAVTRLSADLHPPDGVEVRGYLREQPLQLQARLEARDGRLYVHLERLNGYPLYVVGGIISTGLNRGLSSAWEEAPVRLTAVDVEEQAINAVLEPRSRSAVGEGTSTATVRLTSTPSATSTTGFTAEPTSTQAAAIEKTSSTPTVAATTMPHARLPEPVAPAQGGEYRSPVTFGWRGSLSLNQAYQVTARHTESGHTLQSGLLTTEQWTADVPANRVGEWRWTVSVVEGGVPVATSPEWMFWFNPFPGKRGSRSPIQTPER
jgi:hypothetical protein